MLSCWGISFTKGPLNEDSRAFLSAQPNAPHLSGDKSSHLHSINKNGILLGMGFSE